VIDMRMQFVQHIKELINNQRQLKVLNLINWEWNFDTTSYINLDNKPNLKEVLLIKNKVDFKFWNNYNLKFFTFINCWITKSILDNLSIEDSKTMKIINDA
jgi:hypothetical protein